MKTPMLSVRDLCVDYITEDGPVRGVDRVSVDLYPGETLGLAGESGSGKSTLAKALMRILPPPAVISRGQVEFQGRDVLAMGESELKQLRWKHISMVYQSAMDALNPVISVGEQIVDTLEAHDFARGAAAWKRAGDLLDMVGIDRDNVRAYAHQLSGGMRQRVGIALALALEPDVLILDEPTTALDVIVEFEILSEIRRLQERLGFSVLFITHDLARMLEISDRVGIFYAARLAEIGPTAEIGADPKHPYTAGLLRAFPSLKAGGPEPTSIPGSPPSLADPPKGCRFHPRCPLVEERCRTEAPDDTTLASGRVVRCHLA